MRPTGRAVGTAAAASLLGVAGGFASVALGPVGWVLAFILTVLVAVWLRRRPISLATYLLLLAGTGLVILLPQVIGGHPCPSSGPFGAVTASGSCGPEGCSSPVCYSPMDIGALVAYAGVFAIGLGAGLFGLIRSIQNSGDPAPAG